MAHRATLALVVLLMVIAASAGSFWAGINYDAINAFLFAPQGAPTPAAEHTPPPQLVSLFGTVQQTGTGQITVTLKDGSTKTVAIASTTNLLSAPAKILPQDIKAGATVLVAGNAAPDGTVSAISVQVIPALH